MTESVAPSDPIGSPETPSSSLLPTASDVQVPVVVGRRGNPAPGDRCIKFHPPSSRLSPGAAAERNAATLPVSSPLIRWNEIAKALGHSAPHVAVGQTSQAFFLQDVEKVVDKILTKNSIGIG